MTPTGWRECTLGELAEESGGCIQTGPFGSQLHASDYLRRGIPVVMPVNIGDNRLVEAGVARVGPADAERLSRHRLRVGDIVYSRRGDVEKRALVRESEVGWLCGTGCLLVRLQGDDVDAAYISYWLGSPEIRAWVTQHAIGATMPNLNTGILSAVPVVVPPLVEQKSIAKTLGALDDKIDSNRRAVQAAAQLAQSLLLSDGHAVRLGDVATLDKGVSYKGAGLEDAQSVRARPLVNLGSFPVGSGWMNRSKTKFYSGDFKARHVVTPGDVVVANTDLTQQRAVLGRAVLVPPDLGPSLFSHHVFAVRFHARQDLRLPLWAQLATSAARDRLIGYATGNDGRRPAKRGVARLRGHGAGIEAGHRRSRIAPRTGLAAGTRNAFTHRAPRSAVAGAAVRTYPGARGRRGSRVGARLTVGRSAERTP